MPSPLKDEDVEEQLYQLRDEIRRHAHEYCAVRCPHHEDFKRLLVEANELIDIFYRRFPRARYRHEPDEE